jgi:hypothetical protein
MPEPVFCSHLSGDGRAAIAIPFGMAMAVVFCGPALRDGRVDRPQLSGCEAIDEKNRAIKSSPHPSRIAGRGGGNQFQMRV